MRRPWPTLGAVMPKYKPTTNTVLLQFWLKMFKTFSHFSKMVHLANLLIVFDVF
jgi:hypothetical protein